MSRVLLGHRHEACAVRAFDLVHGLVDTKICAIDGTWSALRFSRRRAPKCAARR